MDKDRAREFFDKAEKYLEWADRSLEEMRHHGRLAQLFDVERAFVAFLSYVDVIHQSLADCLGKLDLDSWRTNLNRDRENDPLLHYLWKARNAEVHDALIKWSPSMRHIDWRITDAEKANACVSPELRGQPAPLIRYLFEVGSDAELKEKLARKDWPSEERQKAAGVELIESLETLGLNDFRSGRSGGTIDAPSRHMGQVLPPSADQAVLFAIRYYRGRLSEVRRKLDSLA